MLSPEPGLRIILSSTGSTIGMTDFHSLLLDGQN